MKKRIVVNLAITCVIVLAALASMWIMHRYFPWACKGVPWWQELETLKVLAVGCVILSVAGPVVTRKD